MKGYFFAMLITTFIVIIYISCHKMVVETMVDQKRLMLPLPCVNKRLCSSRINDPEPMLNIYNRDYIGSEWMLAIGPCIKPSSDCYCNYNGFENGELGNENMWSAIRVSSENTSIANQVRKIGRSFRLGRLARMNVIGLWKSKLRGNLYVWHIVACYWKSDIIGPNKKLNQNHGKCFDIIIRHERHSTKSQTDLFKLSKSNDTTIIHNLEGSFNIVRLHGIGCINDAILHTKIN